MARPSLVCVGPMKTSTSWLYYQLKSHPAVWLSPIKELQLLDFLDVSIHKSSSLRTKAYIRKLTSLSQAIQSVLKEDDVTPDDLERLKTWSNAALAEQFNFDWYSSFFEAAPDDRTVIEIAPTYAYATEENVKRFSEYLGCETSILFVLRNPIDRWLSHGRFDLKLALDQDINDETVPFAAEFILQKWSKVGGYRDYIELWERHFSNVHFVFFEDLHTPEGDGLAQICKLADVPYAASYFPEVNKKVNSQGDDTFPVALRTWLVDLRMDELDWLADRFGGYASEWRKAAQKLIGG